MDETELKTQLDGAAKAERARAAAILDMGQKFGFEKEARASIEAGTPAEKFNAQLLDLIETKSNSSTSAALIGMSGQEVKRFSFIRLLRASHPNSSEHDKKEASFELSVCQAARKASITSERASGGMAIPFDVMCSLKRDLTLSAPAGGPGGNLVATNLMAAEFIEVLRNRLVTQEAGARMLPGLVGNIAIPRQSAPSTAYWVGDNSPATEGDQYFDQIVLSPQTAGALTNISHKLLLQSTPYAEALVRDDIARILAIAVDYAALAGTGHSNSQPLGILNTTGVGSVSWTSAGLPTWANIVAMETDLGTANALQGELAYAFNSALTGTLKTTPKQLTGQTSTFPIALLEARKGEKKGSLLAGDMNGYDCFRSNQIPANTGIFGNWEELVIAMWGGFDLLIDPFTNAASGGVRVRALMDVDVGIRHAASFAKGINPAT